MTGPGAAAALVLALATRAAVADCVPALGGPPAGRIDTPAYRLAYRIEPPPLQVGEPFALEVAVCAAPGEPAPQGLRVDAHMPAHRHGMNYLPLVRPGPPGRYRAEGLVFHMPGQWELRFELQFGERFERLTDRIDLH